MATSPGGRSRLSFFRGNRQAALSGMPSLIGNPLSSIFERQTLAPPIGQTNDLGYLRWIESELDWLSHLPVISPVSNLVFVNEPATSGQFIAPLAITPPNQGTHALLPGNRANHAFLYTEIRLWELMNLVSTYEATPELLDLLHRLRLQLNHLSEQKRLMWDQQQAPTLGGWITVNTAAHFYGRGGECIQSKAARLVTAVLSLLFFTPRRPLRVLLAGTRDILQRAGEVPEFVSSIPKDPNTAFTGLFLDSVIHEYLCCPACYALHPSEHPGNGLPTTPTCTYQLTPTSQVCGSSLWLEHDAGGGRKRFLPRMRHLHHDLKSWVGRLLCRPDLENTLFRTGRVPTEDPSNSMPDIWFSPVFRDAMGPDGTPFLPGPDGEGRLIFSLSVDSFNPFQMKTAKQQVSSTGIWLVLLNLPPHLRYLAENVFLVSLLSGKPSLSQMNHALVLVVNDLLEFWDPGVFFTRTASRHGGRLIRAMLIPLVCDMLAARQVLGLPGTVTAHYFCTFCDLDHDDIDILDKAEWPAKDVQHIREFAGYWKNASSEAHQQKLFEACGLRWSALLDLPYWDPVRYAVIDSMHALDLGLLQHHLRTLFKIDVNHDGGDGSSAAVTPTVKTVTRREEKRELRKCIDTIRRNDAQLIYQLLEFSRKVLYTVCVENDIRGPSHNKVVGTRWVLATNICRWRGQPGFNENSVVSAILSSNDQPILDPQRTAPVDAVLPPNDSIDLTLATRIIVHITNNDPETKAESRRKAFDQGTAALFQYLCRVLDIPLPPEGRKREIFDILAETIDQDENQFLRLKSYIPAGSRNRIVLGKTVMETIWSDMKKTELPTWMRAAPPNWGTTERGKLSADQYRSIGTIHLVVTLIRLWARDTGRRRRMLEHYMHLVSAVRLANFRILSRENVDEYNDHIAHYATSCRELFPDETLKPVLHAAFHLGDMMELFGPVHAYSSPFYERYINFFHQMNTNRKVGELEATLMRTATRAANLRALLADDSNLRGTVFNMIGTMDAIDREDARGSRLANILDPMLPDYILDSDAVAIQLSEEHLQQIRVIISTLIADAQPLRLSRTASAVNRISSQGVTYGKATSATYRNSNIIFNPEMSGDRRTFTPASICEIFQHDYVAQDDSHRHEYYLIVQSMIPVDLELDPYREFGFSAGFLCDRELTRERRVIHISQVISHVALTPIGDGPYEGLIHVLPVDRLMLSYSMDDSSGHPDEDLEVEDLVQHTTFMGIN